MFYFQRMLIRDDVVAEQLANQKHWRDHHDEIDDHLKTVLAPVNEGFEMPAGTSLHKPVSKSDPQTVSPVTSSQELPSPAV
jgi:hypothetical protein